MIGKTFTIDDRAYVVTEMIDNSQLVQFKRTEKNNNPVEQHVQELFDKLGTPSLFDFETEIVLDAINVAGSDEYFGITVSGRLGRFGKTGDGRTFEPSGPYIDVVRGDQNTIHRFTMALRRDYFERAITFSFGFGLHVYDMGHRSPLVMIHALDIHTMFYAINVPRSINKLCKYPESIVTGIGMRRETLLEMVKDAYKKTEQPRITWQDDILDTVRFVGGGAELETNEVEVYCGKRRVDFDALEIEIIDVEKLIALLAKSKQPIAQLGIVGRNFYLGGNPIEANIQLEFETVFNPGINKLEDLPYDFDYDWPGNGGKNENH